MTTRYEKPSGDNDKTNPFVRGGWRGRKGSSAHAQGLTTGGRTTEDGRVGAESEALGEDHAQAFWLQMNTPKG